MNFKLLFLEKNWENWERKEIIEKFIKDFFPGWKLFEKLFSIKNLFHLTIANRFFSLNVNHKWSKLRDFFSSKKWLFPSEFYHYFYFIFFTEPWMLFFIVIYLSLKWFLLSCLKAIRLIFIIFILIISFPLLLIFISSLD